jgi:hypothetical protein
MFVVHGGVGSDPTAGSPWTRHMRWRPAPVRLWPPTCWNRIFPGFFWATDGEPGNQGMSSFS